MSATLSWIAGPGWGEFWAAKGEPWDKFATAETYRQRHFTDGFVALGTILARFR